MQEIYFKSKRRTIYFPFQNNPILLCHACMHSWKTSSGILRSFVVTAFLVSFMSSKWTHLITPLNLEKKNHMKPGWVSREVAPAWGCSSCPGTIGFSGHCEQAHCHGDAAMSCPATALTFSCTMSEANATISLWLIVWPCGKNSQWTMLLTLKNAINMTFWASTVLLSLALVTSDSSTDRWPWHLVLRS